MPVDPADNMKGTEDFLLVVLYSHIVAAANVILCDKDHPTDVKAVSQSIKKRYVKITLPSTSSKSPTPVKAKDQVCVNAMEVLTLGLWWYNFYDSIREGDRNRLVCNWKL